MLLYEIKKLFHRPLTIWIFLLLFVGNAYFSFSQDAPGADYGFGAKEIRSAYEALPNDRDLILPALDAQLEVLDNAVWEDHYEGPLLTKDFYTDLILFRRVRERCETALTYDTYLDSVEQNAIVLQESGIFDHVHSFGYRNIEKSRQTYAALRGVQPEIFYSAAIERFSNRRLTDIALLLVTLLLSLELVYTERKSGTMGLIKPTARGRRDLILSKLLAASLVLLFSVLILYGSNLLIGFYRFGAVSFDAPIQSVFGFEASGMKLSIGEYLLLFTALKYLWLLGICYLLFLLCTAGKSLIQILLALLLCLIPSVLTFQGTGFFSCFNLIGAGDTEALIKTYRNINLFRFPVSTFTVSLGFILIILTVCFFGVIFLHHKSAPVLEEKTGKRKTRIVLSVFRHESYKFWIRGGALFFLVLLLVIQIISAYGFDERISAYDQVYVNYCNAIAGEPSDEKDKYLSDEQDRFDGLYDQMDSYAQMLQEGRIDEQGYQMLCASVRQQLGIEPVFQRVVQQYQRAKETNGHLVCHLPYERLTGKDGRGELLFRLMLMILTLILAVSGIEALEKETHMDSLLHTTIGEEQSNRSKGALCLIYSLLCALTAFVPHFLALHSVYGFSGFFAPARSVPQLGFSFGTVLTCLGLYFLAILLSSLFATLWIRFLSRKTGSTVTSMLLSAATLLLPAAALWLIQIL